MADTGARERLARFFHETYERLAPEFGYETRPESAVPWEQVPEQNRKLMEAVAGAALAAGVGVPPDAGTHNGVPDNFWRQVPCGHPQDPLAALTADGHWVCHCGWALDPADAISSGEDEGAPGLIVPCGKCGCYPALAGVGEARPAEPQPMSLADERALRDLVRGTEAEVQRLREQLDAARRSFERIIENLDGENEDGNIFPQAAERIARAALGDVAAGAEGFSFPPDEDASAISAED